MKQKIPNSFYLYVASKALEKERGWGRVKKKDLELFLNKWNIPRNLRKPMIKEMMILGLIKEEQDGWLVFNKDKCKDGENVGKIYQELGFY